MTESRSLTREGELRVFYGLAVQPLVAALIAFALFPLVAITGRGLYSGYPIDMLDAAVSFALGVGIAGLLMTVFAALPLFLGLLRRGHISQSAVLFSGAAVGNIPVALIVLAAVLRALSSGADVDLDSLTYGLPGAARAVILGSVVGVGSAAGFWWIAGRPLPGTR